MDISLLIVTYRCREVVRDCLQSLFSGGLEGLTAEVLLVDNDSGDGTVEMVQTEFPQVRIVATGENRGFARANNLAAQEAQGRNLLLLNPDTLVPPTALARCVAFLAAQPDSVVAMSCRVESPDGSLQKDCSRRLITPWSECCRALLLDRIFPKVDWFNREANPGWNRRDTRPVEAIIGAFMLIRRSAWESIGGLDERFFLMYEDMDWCKRVADAGKTIVFWHEERIVHLGGQSWKHVPVMVYANSHVSALAYFRKHHPRSVPVVKAVCRFGMELKILLLRLNALHLQQTRRDDNGYTKTHLDMARAARETLRTEQYCLTGVRGVHSEEEL